MRVARARIAALVLAALCGACTRSHSAPSTETEDGGSFDPLRGEGASGASGAGEHGGEAVGDAMDPPPVTPGAFLELAFSPMYSAYDGVHEFRIPVLVQGAETGPLYVDTDPPGFVDWVEDPNHGVTLTIRRAGTTTVRVIDSTGAVGTANLHVSAVEPGQRQLGSDTFYAQTSPDTSACACCHSEDGSQPTAIPGDFREITPQQVGGYSDDELVRILTEGQLPARSFLTTPVTRALFARVHSFDLTEAELQGLVAFLRGFEPRSDGEAPGGWLDDVEPPSPSPGCPVVLGPDGLENGDP